VRAAALALLLAAFAVPAAAQFQITRDEVALDFDREVDFSRYTSFAWRHDLEPTARPENHLRILEHVERGLEAKGLKKQPAAEAQLLLRYYAKVESKLRNVGTTQQSWWQPGNLRTTVDFGKVREGTLILEMYERETGYLVWRGTTTGVVAPPERMEAQVREAVELLLAHYPPTEEDRQQPPPP